MCRFYRQYFGLWYLSYLLVFVASITSAMNDVSFDGLIVIYRHVVGTGQFTQSEACAGLCQYIKGWITVQKGNILSCTAPPPSFPFAFISPPPPSLYPSSIAIRMLREIEKFHRKVLRIKAIG